MFVAGDHAGALCAPSLALCTSLHNFTCGPLLKSVIKVTLEVDGYTHC